MTITAETLDRSRGMVAPALRLAVERLDPFTRLVVSYHLGWSDEHGTPTVANPGKTLRPALALLAAEAVTGRPEPGLPGAVAVELVHNFSLLHDDLMDRDTERRHRRTVWAVWGDATAVLAGDALLSLAHEVLTEGESPDGQAAGQALAIATRELIRGQVLDLAFEQRNDVTLDECLDMAAGSWSVRRRPWWPGCPGSVPNWGWRSSSSTTCSGSGDRPRSRASRCSPI
jgi:geranylgeranyl diphosphate synthase, type I